MRMWGNDAAKRPKPSRIEHRQKPLKRAAIDGADVLLERTFDMRREIEPR